MISVGANPGLTSTVISAESWVIAPTERRAITGGVIAGEPSVGET